MVKVLDVGCGNALPNKTYWHDLEKPCTSILACQGGKGSYGVDINQDRLDEARENIKNGTDFVWGNVAHLFFGSNYFDIVHSSGLLHHTKYWTMALSEMVRVCKKGGQILIEDTVEDDPIFRLGRKVFTTFKGDKVQSHFKSRQLVDVLKIGCTHVSYELYWRSYLCDFLADRGIEPSWACKYNHIINKVLSKLGLSLFSSHIIIRAIK